MINQVTYSWVEDIAALRRIASAWDDAVVQAGGDNPFLTSHFLFAWWRQYAAVFRPRFLVVWRDGRVLGGLPLCQDKTGCLEYPGGPAANYTEVLAVPGEDERVWRAVFSALAEAPHWRSVRFPRYRKHRLKIDVNQIPEPDAKMQMPRDVFRSDDAYVIDVPRDVSAHRRALPKKLRYYLRRSYKRCADLGELRLCSLQTTEELDEWFAQFVRLSRTSFRKRRQRSAFEDNRHCAFFKDLLTTFYRTGYLDAHALKLGDHILAIHFGYTLEHNLNYVLTAFESEFLDLNPGHLLIDQLLQLAATRGDRQVNFYTGSQLYKRQWSNRTEEVVTVEIWRPGMRNRLERSIRTTIRRSPIAGGVADLIRSHPSLHTAARRMKGLLKEGLPTISPRNDL